MLSRTRVLSPVVQAAIVLLGSAVLAGALAIFHPERRSVAELASIPLLREAALDHASRPVIRITPGSSQTDSKQWNFVFTPENWETQLEALAGHFHGDEQIVIGCQTAGCEEAWAMAKRLRRYGFPRVALLQEEGKK